MEPQQQTINQLKQEYQAYLSSGSALPFQPSSATSMAISKLVRFLEIKRQTSSLTTQENHWLKSIDQIFEEIANSNRKKSPSAGTPGAPVAGKKLVYDLHQGQPKEEPEDQTPVVIPRISEEEADKIISTINEQFEEKVMKKLKNRPPPEEPIPPAVAAESMPQTEGPQNGRSLQDYLKTMIAERPDHPFQDEDSNVDLSKIQTRV